MTTNPIGDIQPWQVFLTVLGSILTLAGVLYKLIKSFHKSVMIELRVTRIAIKELLADLAARNPTAMGRIVAAIDDESIIEFVQSNERRRKPRN
jgi:hypothetical protein